MDAIPQLSLVDGEPNATPVAAHDPASAEVETFAGHVIEGACVSVTVTVCVQLAVLPFTSVTVHVTVVVPTGYEDGALFVVDATPQLSLVDGVPNATPLAAHDPASADAETFAGQVITGACVSVTVTVCVQLAVLPFTSVTVHVTVVVPTG